MKHRCRTKTSTVLRMKLPSSQNKALTASLMNSERNTILHHGLLKTFSLISFCPRVCAWPPLIQKVSSLFFFFFFLLSRSRTRSRLVWSSQCIIVPCCYCANMPASFLREHLVRIYLHCLFRCGELMRITFSGEYGKSTMRSIAENIRKRILRSFNSAPLPMFWGDLSARQIKGEQKQNTRESGIDISGKSMHMIAWWKRAYCA